MIFKKETDKELVKKALRNRKNFKKLYLRYVQKIYRHLRYRLNSNEDAEDLTTEVFLKALENLEKYNFQYELSTWLMTITRNTLIDFWRQQKYSINLEKIFFLIDQNNLVKNLDINLKIDYIMSKLNETEKALITMRFEKGLSYKEISVITGRSEQSLRTMFSRIKKIFKKENYE